MTRYECETRGYGSFSDLSNSVRDMGISGWEPVSVVHDGTNYVVVFKRPLKATSPCADPYAGGRW